MTKKEKKVVFTLIAIAVVILLIVIIVKSVNKDSQDQAKVNNVVENVENEEEYVTELSDGTKLNNSEDLNNTHTYKGVEISNVQFTSQNGNSVLLADVKNTRNSTFTEEEATIVLLGENNEILRKIAVYIPSLVAGESKEINSIVTADVVNVKDFRVEAAK